MKKIIDFTDKIDCNFPYNDLVLGKELILEAKDLGLEAIFYLCCELCNIPHGTKVSQENMMTLFNFLKENISFQGYEFLLELMEKHFSQSRITEDEILEAMTKVASLGEYIGAIALLNILDQDYSDKIEDMTKIHILAEFGKWQNL